MKVTDKMASKWLKYFLSSFLVFILGIIIFTIFMIPQIRFGNTPEQSKQVEVVEKKFETTRTTSGGGRVVSSTNYTYYVSFKFPGGSVKEFRVGRDSVKRDYKRKPYCFSYDSLNEGDMGLLTYKEWGNAENLISAPTDYRLFISFEQNPEYGGLKVEMYERHMSVSEIWLTVIIFALALLFLFYAIGLNKRRANKLETEKREKNKREAFRIEANKRKAYKRKKSE